MVRCEIGVVGHHTRAEQARQLANTVDASYLSIDDGTLGANANHRHVWEWLHQHHSGATHLVVLEDDAQPVTNFRDQLNQALAVAPCDVVSLYLGAGRPLHVQPRIRSTLDTQPDVHWLTYERLLHAVGVCIRTELLPMQLDTRRPIDEAITRWCKQNCHNVAYTVPSLVDHRDDESVIQHRHNGMTRTRPRRAWRLGTRNHWTPKAAHLA